ncbi:MAG: hypothetical protein Q9195_005476 [Heterodermia aff. obscurata]
MPKKTQTQSSASLDTSAQPESAATTTTNSPESNQKKSKLDKTSEDDSDWGIIDKPGDAQSKKELDAGEAGTSKGNDKGGEKQVASGKKKRKGKKDRDIVFVEEKGTPSTPNGGEEILDSTPNGGRG